MANNEQLIREKGYNYTSNVFDVFIQDPTSDRLIAHADSLSESTFNIETEMSEKRGGPQNATLYYIPTSKTISINMTNIAFEETWLALQTGEKFELGEYEIFGSSASCEVTESGGKRTITLPEAPVGANVYVKDGFENISVPVNSSSPETVDVTNITNSGDTCLEVIYATKARVKHMSVKGSTSPTVVKLTMVKKVVNGSTSKPIKEFVIVVPRFQLDGNLALTGTLGDNDPYGLSGYAIAAKSTQCGNTEQVLADVFIRELDEASLAIVEIATAEEYEVATGAKEKITVFGSLGSNLVYSDFDVTAECTYVSGDTDIATVGTSTGEVTGVSTGDTEINITHSSGKKTSTKVIVI